MTDENLLNQDDTQLTEPEASEEQQTKEQLYNKQQVSDVVKRERQRAYEKGRKEAMMQLQEQEQNNPSQGLGGMPNQQMPAGLTADDVQRMIAEQTPQALNSHIQQFKANQMVDTFVSKMQAAEQKHPGLEQELSKLNYDDPRMHAFIELANTFDNTGDIMKEVIDHPHKLQALLADVKNQPYLAQKQMQSLAQSIRQNEEAKAQESQVKDPLGQLKPSSMSGADAANMSVSDFRKMLRSR